MDNAEVLAAGRRIAMVAPAGCGKTYMIVDAIKRFGSGRELVLTHTHAGVDAIRNQLHQRGVPSARFQVDTIAGWALRLATSYPATSGVHIARPENELWGEIYSAITALVGLGPISEIIRASYSGVYVDEYQDCTLAQHELVAALAEVLPCRVLGDPLQGIFDFEPIVSWDDHVGTFFNPICGEHEPWRWADSNPDLGGWLMEARDHLEDGRRLEINGPVRWVDASDERQRQATYQRVCSAAERDLPGSIIVIRNQPNQLPSLARRLGGRFQCVEIVDCGELRAFAKMMDVAEGHERAVAVIDYAKKFATKVGTETKSIHTGLSEGRTPKVRKNKDQLGALLAVTESPRLDLVEDALKSLVGLPGVKIYRRDLYFSAVRAIREVVAGEVETMEAAADLVQDRRRYVGRAMARAAIGTTLRVKGLEFDHAIVLDADEYSVKNLYVALTRGARSLTVVSNKPYLQPYGT